MMVALFLQRWVTWVRRRQAVKVNGWSEMINILTRQVDRQVWE